MGPFARFRSSLTYPIAATLVLVTVVPVVVVGLLLAQQNRDYLRTLEKQYLARQAAGLASEISLFFAAHRTQLESTARALEAGPPVDQDSAEALLQAIARRDPTFLHLQIVNRNGAGAYVRTRVLSADAESAIQTVIDAVDKQVMEGGTPTSELHVRVPSLRSGVAVLAYPLRSSSGEQWGVLDGVVDLGALESRLTDYALGGLLVSIIDGDGDTVVSSRTDFVGRSLAASPLVHDFLRKPLRLTQVYPHPLDNVVGEVLGSVSPIAWPAWGVVVERPLAQAFATVRAMQTRTLVVTLIAALLALGIGLALGRRLLRPIQTLAGVTTQVAEGNLAVRADVRGRDEIARLAGNFNHMAGNVEALVRRLKHALRQNQELFLETIRTLAAAIDAKDPYTRGHSERVSSYSMAVARHLGMSQDEVFTIRIAAILHDVGKLGIKDKILNKPGGLTDQEYETMKQHPAIGAQIMAQISMLKDIIPGIRNHHETWDGTGYPDALAGEQIPMVARIVCVADTFDAMTTTRPYQRAMPAEHVMAKMRAMAGTRFDPEVVDAFSAAVRTGDITPPVPRDLPVQEAQ